MAKDYIEQNSGDTNAYRRRRFKEGLADALRVVSGAGPLSYAETENNIQKLAEAGSKIQKLNESKFGETLGQLANGALGGGIGEAMENRVDDEVRYSDPVDSDYNRGELVDNRSVSRTWNHKKNSDGTGSYNKGEPYEFGYGDNYQSTVDWSKGPSGTYVSGPRDWLFKSNAGNTLPVDDWDFNGTGMVFMDPDLRDRRVGAYGTEGYRNKERYSNQFTPYLDHNDNQNYRSAYEKVYKSGGRGSKK